MSAERNNLQSQLLVRDQQISDLHRKEEELIDAHEEEIDDLKENMERKEYHL